MKNKSLFIQILKYFLVTLILPFITIIFLYGYAENTLKDQVVLSSERTLGQFFALVDNVMEEVTQTNIAIACEDVCDEYSRAYMKDPNSAGYTAVEVRKILDEYQKDTFFDILVYYPTLDHIISLKNGSLPAFDYLAATYGRSDDYQEQYAALLSCDETKPRISAFQDANGQTYLVINMRWVSIREPSREHIVSIVFEPEYISELMIQERLHDAGTLLIFDADKKLLLSGDGATFYSLATYDQSGSLMQIDTENGTYMMLAEPAQVISGYYAYATNMDLFWAGLLDLRLVCMAACLLCLVTTVVLAIRGTKNVYNPIGTVVQRIEQIGVASYDRKEHNEIEFIEKILEKGDIERKDLRRQVRKGKDQQCEQFVLALLKGKIEPENMNNAALEKVGFPVASNAFRVVLIFVQKRQDMDLSMQDFVIHNVFEEVSRANGYGYIVELSANQYALFINYEKQADPEKEMENLRDCQRFVSQQLGLEMVLAAGRVHQGLEEAHKSYDEAELAMKHKYLLEDADYIDYKDIRNREFIYSSYMESNLSRSIIGFINGKTQEPAVEDFVEETMQLCHIDADTAMDNVECFKYEMVSIINKAFMICGVSEDRKERIQQLVMQPTLEKFRTELASLLQFLRQQKQHGSKQDLICQRAAEYIAENYRNPQLSVTQLGEELKLSPYYASKLFKEKYEMSMPDYVAKTRVQKAKEQLRNTDLSIKEIAEQNGFLSSNVFIRTFKKWEGVTPGIYREDGKKWQQ